MSWFLWCAWTSKLQKVFRSVAKLQEFRWTLWKDQSIIGAALRVKISNNQNDFLFDVQRCQMVKGHNLPWIFCVLLQVAWFVQTEFFFCVSFPWEDLWGLKQEKKEVKVGWRSVILFGDLRWVVHLICRFEEWTDCEGCGGKKMTWPICHNPKCQTIQLDISVSLASQYLSSKILHLLDLIL